MSGGYFDYSQYNMQSIAESIKNIIYNNKNEEENEWGEKRGMFFSDEIIDLFSKTEVLLRVSEILVNRADYLLSCDDGPDSYIRRVKEDLNHLFLKKDEAYKEMKKSVYSILFKKLKNEKGEKND